MKRIAVRLLLIGFAFFGASCSTTKPLFTEADLYKPNAVTNLTCDGVRIASFNTEFMFDGTGDEGGATFDWKGSVEMATEHRRNVGQVIRSLNADVILLAEVENAEVAQALVDDTLIGMGYKVYFVQGKDTFTGQDVAVISRIPITETGRSDDEVRVGTTTRTYGVSKNLYARFNIGSVPVTLIGVHLLAQPMSVERKPQREAQAEVIRRMVEAEIKNGREVIVAGDFNDFDNETLDRNFNVPISDVLRTIKSAGRGTEDDLHNLLADVPQSIRFTSLYDSNNDHVALWREMSAIDHMLLSPKLYNRVLSVGYIHAHNPFTITDHFPVTACLAK